MVLGIRVVREILDSKKEEVRGDWRKVRDEELHYLYSKY
jgi:hypothetical protein